MLHAPAARNVILRNAILQSAVLQNAVLQNAILQNAILFNKKVLQNFSIKQKTAAHLKKM